MRRIRRLLGWTVDTKCHALPKKSTIVCIGFGEKPRWRPHTDQATIVRAWRLGVVLLAHKHYSTALDSGMLGPDFDLAP